MSQSKPTKAECTAYAKNYILTGDKTKSFRVAFPKCKSKPDATKVQACRFHQIHNVLLTIDDLRGKIEGEAKKEALYTIEDKKRILLDVALYGSEIELKSIGPKDESMTFEQQRNPSATVAAIKELNMMDGDHAAIKTLNKNLDKSDSFEEYASKRGK